MACEKYSSWMTDAALGALAPWREPELLAHTAECDVCREAYEHARNVVAFVDRGVESLVSGEPSARFSARLRARIAEGSAPAHTRWAVWVPATAGALALAIVILGLVMRSPRHSNPNSGMAVTHGNQSSLPQSVAVNPLPQPAMNHLSRVSHAHHANRSAALHTKKPEVLVQPGQFEAVLQYADALRSGRIDGDKLIAAQQSLVQPLEVAPIEIPPLDAPKNDSDAADPTNNSGHQ